MVLNMEPFQPDCPMGDLAKQYKGKNKKGSGVPSDMLVTKKGSLTLKIRGSVCPVKTGLSSQFGGGGARLNTGKLRFVVIDLEFPPKTFMEHL